MKNPFVYSNYVTLMNILSKYSQKRKLVIAFDEFQEVADYTEEDFEKRLRLFIQQHSNICYLFSGSQQHLIIEMFNSNNRAFYKLAESVPLSKIEYSLGSEFIQQEDCP